MDPATAANDTTALFICSGNEDDPLLVEQMERAGFTVRRLPFGDSCPPIDSLDHPPPTLLLVDAQAIGQLPDPRELDALGAREVIVIGNSEQQSRLNGWFARGDALFLCRPLDHDYFADLLDDLISEERRETLEPEAPTATSMDQYGLLYGSSAPMKKLYRLLRKASASDAFLFISGESGTGKELVARSVHAYSSRSQHPFEGLNCGALPSELVESELFGHEKGSFSGAHRTHRGLFERVERGTLLLDEITEMPESAQVTLLRVIETGHFRRVGGEQDIPCLARVIAATNRAPREAVSQGRLREDLYYRLQQMCIEVPPLRDRGNDVIHLARRFARDFTEQSGLTCALSEASERLLARQHWPGNVRQLRNTILSACRLSGGLVEPGHMTEIQHAPSTAPSGETLSIRIGTPIAEAQRRLILATLSACGGDKHIASQQLGISLRTLYNRLKEYGAGT